MPPPFSETEYAQRLSRVQDSMSERGLDALVIGDPANMNWLTGFDAWSFYVPQVMVVTHDGQPVWIGRAMDAGAAGFTTYLPEACIRPWGEELVQRHDAHPMEYAATVLCELGLAGKRLGYESDTYFFSPKSLDCLQAGVPNADWIDADLLVNWCRAVKSDAEIVCMEQASRLVEGAMSRAYETIKPGMRQCDLMATILAAQVGGNPDFGGDLTALSPLILAGEAASTAHPMWTDEPFAENQTVALELGGTRKRYNAGLARTVQLGKGPQVLFDTAKAVEEGMEAVLDTVAPGISCGEVHAAWQKVLDRYGLVKESRIGYGIGVGYSPDWGEHTISLRPGEGTILQTHHSLHIILGMWMEGWGMELSETVLVTARGCRCLTDFGRSVHVVD